MATRAQPSEYDLAPGRSLGPGYEVVDFLGRGWEGDVYKIVEVATGIERAAKLFYPRRNLRGKALQQYARKLDRLRDASAIIQYHHRGTARVQGRAVEFLVSEFVEGDLLSTVVKRLPGKRFQVFEALHLLYSLTCAVVPIHQAGEYHGDLHTDNIIVRRKGIGFDVKLIDFFDLGRPTKHRMADDVFDLIAVFYELIGGASRYRSTGPEIKRVVCGKRRAVIARRYPTAARLKEALEKLEWR